MTHDTSLGVNSVARAVKRSPDLAELTASEVMTAASEVISVDTSLWEALERFFATGAHHLVVLDENGHVDGIVAAQHLARLWAGDEHPLQRMSVATIPYSRWVGLTPDTSMRDTARVLTEFQIDVAPVCSRDGELLGVVTAGSIVAAYARRR